MYRKFGLFALVVGVVPVIAADPPKVEASEVAAAEEELSHEAAPAETH